MKTFWTLKSQLSAGMKCTSAPFSLNSHRPCPFPCRGTDLLNCCLECSESFLSINIDKVKLVLSEHAKQNRHQPLLKQNKKQKQEIKPVKKTEKGREEWARKGVGMGGGGGGVAGGRISGLYLLAHVWLKCKYKCSGPRHNHNVYVTHRTSSVPMYTEPMCQPVRL